MEQRQLLEGELERYRPALEALALDRVGNPETARDIAQGRSATVSQVAVNWVLSHPEVTVAVTGPNKIEHVEDSAGATDWELSGEERRRLDEAPRRPQGDG